MDGLSASRESSKSHHYDRYLPLDRFFCLWAKLGEKPDASGSLIRRERISTALLSVGRGTWTCAVHPARRAAEVPYLPPKPQSTGFFVCSAEGSAEARLSSG